MLQSAKPEPHAPTRQAPAAQDALALENAQLTPQPPQFMIVSREASQPFMALPSQSPKPARHALPQTPAAQKRVAFIGVGHTVLQPPQASGSTLVARQVLLQLV
jgi:hypothetical protein